jgi:SagB-type dehydrogenase family enzyme
VTQLVYNYATQQVHPGSPVVSAVLDAAARWTTRDAVRKALSQWDEEVVDRAIDDLLERGSLDEMGRPRGTVERALERWGGWNPVAAFFHRATQRQPTADATSSSTGDDFLVPWPYPPMVKSYAERTRIELPTDFAAAPVGELLRARRTWRAFGERAPALHEISALLGLTFGVQLWADAGGDRWAALKTSPSAGARHSLEAYLLAFRVDGLDAGTYHYCPDGHALTPLDAATPQSLLETFLPYQPWFRDAPAVVVMSSVFERVRYKYATPHAYRVILLDAGHLSQTFALTATAMGLAPFCTATLDHPAIERHLGLDGVEESVLFAVGVGTRPDAEAAWPRGYDGVRDAPTALPQWARRHGSA